MNRPGKNKKNKYKEIIVTEEEYQKLLIAKAAFDKKIDLLNERIKAFGKNICDTINQAREDLRRL